MCFGGKPKAKPTPTPAPAPAPPVAAPEEEEIGSARKAEEDQQFGPKGPRFRVNRPTLGGTGGGSGVQM